MSGITDPAAYDVGSGTGYFSRRFAEAGLEVTGIDPAPAMVHYARIQAGTGDYLEGCAVI